MKQSILVTGFLLFFRFLLPAQDIAGTWSGMLKTPMGELTIVFHLENESGNYSGTMDSPDQNATGIVLSKVEFDDPDLRIEVSSLGVVYNARLEGDSLNGTFKQSGMSFPLVLKKGAVEEAVLNRPQEPQPPFPYRTEDVEFVNRAAGNIKLAGTLTLPEKGKKFPAVILISGSGPQDRDETLMGHKPFWVIADYLTRRGIAVLRFDDRGTAQSEGNFETATTADFVTDVEAAIQFLNNRKDIHRKKIGLIGHSEGGIVAPMVAAVNKKTGFIILLAGTGVPGNELLLMQNEAILRASGSPEIQIAILNKVNESIYDLAMSNEPDSVIEKGIKEKLMPLMPFTLSKEEKESAAAAQAAQVLTPWMRYFLKNDPAEYLKKVTCPVLAVNGSKDMQVPAEENIDAIRKALESGRNKRVTTRIFPGLNHLFQHAETGLPAEYQKIEETFSPEVLAFIGDWIEQQVK